MDLLDYHQTVQRLKELAKNAIDLSQPGQLSASRLEAYVAKALGFTLLYGTEKVTDEVMKALEALAQESSAVPKMKQMQAGHAVNSIEGYRSENRPALHTATRDFFDHPQVEREAAQASKLAMQEIEKLKEFIKSLETSQQFSDLVVIGIGGSELGPHAHYQALRYLPHRSVHFIGNLDPDETSLILRDLDLKTTLVAVISKTGTTLETTTNEERFRWLFKEAELSPQEHFISITMAGSPLDNPTQYLQCFHLWDWVGGRYSTTSMVGGVLLAFAFGFNVYWEFLQGAHAMDQVALGSDLSKNLPLLAALLGIWNRNFLNYPTLAIIPYSQALQYYPKHIQQLDMESNGKRINRQGGFISFDSGPIIWGEPGTNAQHSFFQLLHQGTSIVPVEFIGFLESQLPQDFLYQGTTSQQKLLANLFAQILALAKGKSSDNPNTQFPGNRPSHLIFGKQLTPYSLGALLAFYEHKVAFQGFIWGINSFDQEGVQLGKVLANQIIECFSKKIDSSDPLVNSFLKWTKN